MYKFCTRTRERIENGSEPGVRPRRGMSAVLYGERAEREMDK